MKTSDSSMTLRPLKPQGHCTVTCSSAFAQGVFHMLLQQLVLESAFGHAWHDVTSFAEAQHLHGACLL